MLNRSGYGILRDTWHRSIPDSEWYPIDDVFNMICKYKTDSKLEETNEYGIVKNTCKLNRESLEGNIKSKYIEANPKDNPIIQSRSLSLRSVGRLETEKLIFNLLNVWLNSNHKSLCRESIEEFIKLNNYHITYEDVLNLYNTRESNFMPTRNYDLLDTTYSDSDIDFRDTIFYDKLVPYLKNPLFAFRNNGQLYNISPNNIPVLTKISPLMTTSINDNPFRIEYDKDKMSPLFDVLKIATNCDNECICVSILFRVKPHFRTIRKSDGNIDIYVPNMIITLDLFLSRSKLAKAIKIVNYYSSLGEEVPDTILNMKIVDDTDEYLVNSINIIANFDLRAFYAFKKMNSDEWYRSRKYYNELDERDSEKEELLQTCIDYFDMDSSDYLNFNEHYYPTWPFGNVYESGHACMKYNSLLKGLTTYRYLYMHHNILSINELIQNFFSNFMSDSFNSDLQIEYFITKEQWEEYFLFKERFIDMEDGFTKFVNTLSFREFEGDPY